MPKAEPAQGILGDGVTTGHAGRSRAAGGTSSGGGAAIRCVRDWQSSLANLFDTTLVGEEAVANFHGDVTGFHLGDSLTFNNASVAQRLVRDVKRVRRSGVDHIMLRYQTSGRLTGDYDGRAVALNAGDIGFVDFGRATASEDTDFSRITLIVPRKQLHTPRNATCMASCSTAAMRPPACSAIHDGAAAVGRAVDGGEASSAVDAAFVLAEGAWNATDEAGLERKARRGARCGRWR